MTIGQVVSLSDEVDEIDASASNSEALFTKELCDLLITLEPACPRSGKEIIDILTRKDSRDIIKKVKKFSRASARRVTGLGRRSRLHDGLFYTFRVHCVFGLFCMC
jgi:hypothetical protein